MLLDRADGDLARLTGRTSPGGHTYDLIADSLSNALFFVGLGVGLRDGDQGLWAVPMGLLAGGAVAAILWMVMRIEETKGARAAELGGFAGFDPDDAILIAPVAIWWGMSEGLLLAAAVGAPAFALFFAWLFWRKK
jgi:archaetidylinositol phosphate synthase